MFLYLKRSQRRTWFGGRTYKLTAYVEASDDERRFIGAHSFTEKLAYIVPLDHVADLDKRAEAAWQRQKKLSVFKQEDTGKILWENAKVVALSIRANCALRAAFRVSIGDLVGGGIVVEGALGEVLQVEASIGKAFDNLKRLVDHASTFEQDAESIFEPDQPEDQFVAPPSTWPRYTRG